MVSDGPDKDCLMLQLFRRTPRAVDLYEPLLSDNARVGATVFKAGCKKSSVIAAATAAYYGSTKEPFGVLASYASRAALDALPPTEFVVAPQVVTEASRRLVQLAAQLGVRVRVQIVR